MVKKVLIVIGAAVVAVVLIVLILAATKPDQLHVERSAVIDAPPEQVFPYANDLRKFTTWMPWTELDPNQTTAFSEPSSGVGAWYTWKGNDEVGQGRMEVIASEPGKVVHSLQFIEPFESTAESSVIMEASGDGQTKVTWAFDQDANFGSKLMMVFMDMDAMLGADFEKGLNNLAARVKADQAPG